ncbi:hypothetical protein KW796_01050 [Candidatus Parcubacteria bacterium]|nr:hypothetical protein [Candidatus Parcubacteria bacterium]
MAVPQASLERSPKSPDHIPDTSRIRNTAAEIMFRHDREAEDLDDRMYLSKWSLTNHSTRLSMIMGTICRKRNLAPMLVQLGEDMGFLHDVSKAHPANSKHRERREWSESERVEFRCRHPADSALWIESFRNQVCIDDWSPYYEWLITGVTCHHDPSGIKDPPWLIQMVYDVCFADKFESAMEDRENPKMGQGGAVEFVQSYEIERENPNHSLRLRYIFSSKLIIAELYGLNLEELDA